VVTGILLTLYYRPSAEEAYESVQFIMIEVQFGWLIRSIHSWSANLMVATMMIHLFSVYLTQAYRKPRELTWVTGMLLFGRCSGFLGAVMMSRARRFRDSTGSTSRSCPC